MPNGWSKVYLKNILASNVKNGFSPNAVDVDTGYVVLGLGALTDGKLNLSETKNVEPVEAVKKSILTNGDFLVSRSNTPDKVGRSAIFRGEIKNCSYPDLMMRFTIDQNIANLEFIEATLKSSKVRQYYKSCASGSSSSMVKITKPIVEKTPIELPPLPEQCKIAKILSTWDKAIITTESLIDNSKKQKKVLMQQLLTGKSRLINSSKNLSIRDGFSKSKLGSLPDDWSLALVSEFYWYQEGPGVRKHQFTESGVKLFNGTNIQNSRVNLLNTNTYISTEQANGAYSHFLADPGDLVIACSGISVDRFDEKISFLKSEHLPLCMNTSTMRFKVKENQQACLTFLLYFMMSPLFKNQIRRQITGSAQLNFGPSHVGKCFIALPQLEEQKRISTVLSNADKEIDILEQQLADLKQEKKALMQQLLTGKRRVKIN
jgi:type I restriction enzyme S subunit